MSRAGAVSEGGKERRVGGWEGEEREGGEG